MEKLDYKLTVLPIPTPRPKVTVIRRRGKKPVPQAYYPGQYGTYKNALTLLIQSLRIPPGDYQELEVVFYLPYPKGTAKKRLIEGFPHTKKPDVDNFLKGLMDGLELAEVISNDSKFYSVKMRKVYTVAEPRIEFSLK